MNLETSTFFDGNPTVSDSSPSILPAIGSDEARNPRPLRDSVMNYVKGNQTRASEVLGLNRGTLRKKLKQYGLL